MKVNTILYSGGILGVLLMIIGLIIFSTSNPYDDYDTSFNAGYYAAAAESHRIVWTYQTDMAQKYNWNKPDIFQQSADQGRLIVEKSKQLSRAGSILIYTGGSCLLMAAIVKGIIVYGKRP